MYYVSMRDLKVYPCSIVKEHGKNFVELEFKGKVVNVGSEGIFIELVEAEKYLLQKVREEIVFEENDLEFRKKSLVELKVVESELSGIPFHNSSTFLTIPVSDSVGSEELITLNPSHILYSRPNTSFSVNRKFSITLVNGTVLYSDFYLSTL